MNKIVIGIIAALVLFMVPTVAADNVLYFVPQDSSGDPEEDVTVLLYCNATDAIGGGQISIYFDHDIVNITQGVEMSGTTDWISWNFYPYGYAGHSYVQITFAQWGGSFTGDMIGIATLTLAGDNLGVSPLEMPVASDKTMLFTPTGPEVPTTSINGTFTCGGAQTFTKSLPAGWNLISLPLTATDNTTGTVLSGVTQNAVKQYNAVTKQFEDATTMDPGTGYFVHVTTAGTWSYSGMSESSTSTELKSGLNMIGVPNCVMSVEDAMDPIDYRYAARWNATSQSYEVYNPNAPEAFHGFSTMEPGEGYFVSAKSDATLPISCP